MIHLLRIFFNIIIKINLMTTYLILIMFFFFFFFFFCFFYRKPRGSDIYIYIYNRIALGKAISSDIKAPS